MYRSVRAEKPFRLMLLPIVPPSAAPMVRPGTLRSALASEVEPCDCITAWLMIVTDCGTSFRSAGSRVVWAALPPNEVLSLSPWTVTSRRVCGTCGPEGAGAEAAGAPGLVPVAPAGLAVGAGAACWAIAPAIEARLRKATTVGFRRPAGVWMRFIGFEQVGRAGTGTRHRSAILTANHSYL